jgi:peptide/nickel transport system substrate-binding protein
MLIVTGDGTMAAQLRRAGRAQRSISRRRLIAGSSAAAAALAVACKTRSGAGSSAGQSAGQTAKQPKSGGTLNYAGGVLGSFDIQGRTFDPDIQTQSGARSYTLWYDRLLAYDLVTWQVQPSLAQKWEQPSQTEYLFHLVPNVKWQNKPPVNGRLMTTDDILYSLERARTNDPKFSSRSLLAQVDKIEAPDSGTIRITTTEPDASTLNKLSTDNLAILSKEVFDKYPKPITADAAVGTGPFIMKSEEDNVGAEYVRNPDYWIPGRPYLDTFRTRNFPDAQTAYAAFTANQIDVMVLDGNTAKSYIASRGAGFKPDWGPDDTIGGFLYPNTKMKPLDDPRVTQALRLMLDHDEWLSAWANTQNGKGGIGGVFPPVRGAWDLSEQEYRTHLEWKQPKDDAVKQAGILLAAAGYSKDNPLKFTSIANNNPAGQSGLQLMQAQWKKFSQGIVDIDIKLLEQAQIDAARANRSFQYGQFGTSAGPGEPDIWLSAVYHSGASQNFMGLSDPKLDAMIDKQRGIFDATQRKALVRQIVLYLIDNGPSTIGATLFYLHAVQPRVQGYQRETHYLNGRDFSWVWLQQ